MTFQICCKISDVYYTAYFYNYIGKISLKKDTMFWVALDDNDRVIDSVGYSINQNSNTEAFVYRLFIKPNMKRCGIGTDLLKVAECEMKNKRITTSLVHLGEPKEQWYESYSFYTKHGYEEYQPRFMKKIFRRV